VALTQANVVTFLYVGIFPSVLAFLFYNYGVSQVGPERASLFIHLMPVFGTIMSVLFLGEHFRLFHAVGISSIFAGIYLSTRPVRTL
jgi:drug/metabolite transporter (DMT)-like permease